MSMTSVQAGVLRRRSPRPARLLRNAIAHLRERLRIRREIASFADLPDHLLRDVCLEEYIARLPRDLPPDWR